MAIFFTTLLTEKCFDLTQLRYVYFTVVAVVDDRFNVTFLTIHHRQLLYYSYNEMKELLKWLLI